MAYGEQVEIDKNPVARYAHFCRVYNSSCNVVDGKEYELPDLNSWKYKLFRFSWNPFSKLSNCDFDCDSFWVFFKLFFYLCLFAWPMLLLFSAIFFGLSRGSRSSSRDLLPAARALLIVSTLLSLPPFLLALYNVVYLSSFFRLVGRNFQRVPRDRVLSNMVFVRDLPGFQNRYLEIKGHVAAALRRNEISYDQIKDEATLKRLQVRVGVELETVDLMVYQWSFVENLDNYNIGFVKRVNLLIGTSAILGVVLWMLIVAFV